MTKKQPIRKVVLTTIITIQSQTTYYVHVKQQGFVGFKHTLLFSVARTYAANMPATCLRQGRRCYWRYSPTYVYVCRRHAAEIAGCPGQSAITAFFLSEIFGVDFSHCEFLSAADADIPATTLSPDCSIASPNSSVFKM